MSLMFTKLFYVDEPIKKKTKPGFINVRKYPEYLFVFGDNLERVGKGGQATIRDAENTLGIATKVSTGEFITEDNWLSHKEEIDKDLDKLDTALQLKVYKAVVIPLDFIGTGLAKLPVTSPTAYAHIYHRINVMMHLYGVVFDELTSED